MTFSLTARCAQTAMLGIAVSSSSPAVAARCAHVRAGVGAAASQNVTDPRLGPHLLDLLADGLDAEGAIGHVVREGGPALAFRQLACVDAAGGVASYSGSGTLGTHGTREADGCVAAGNLLAGVETLDAMTASFAASSGHLASRLLAALAAGEAAGGEEGPVRSAGVLVVHDVPWPVVDLRVDWHDDPIAELGRIWEVYEPQWRDYVLRALDPRAAPSFGVPGDE
jgi:uncharacterized Ntn-hydrolase superfamily protein